MGRAMKFLIGLNVFTTIMGLAMLISASYAKAQINDQAGWFISNSAAVIGIIAGLFTLLLSVVGCVGAAAREKRMLCCYMVGLFFVLMFQIGAAVAMTNYANSLKVQNPAAPSSSLTYLPDIVINNAVFSAFTKCCSGCPGNGTCNNPIAGSFVNYTLPNCVSATNLTCPVIQACGAVPTATKCFVFPYSTPVVVPPVSLDDRLCTALSNIPSGNGYLVGPIDQTGCGGGDPTLFYKQLDSFVSNSLYGVAGFFTFVAVVEGLAFAAGIFLVFCGRKGTVAKEDEDAGNFVV